MYFSSAGSSDFEDLPPQSVFIGLNDNATTPIYVNFDIVSLEYNDRIRLGFTPDFPHLRTTLEANFGEYLRDSATVNIIDEQSEFPSLISDAFALRQK